MTLHPQTGNPPVPAYFALPLDRAALNRMGANNLGAAVMADTLEETWQRSAQRSGSPRDRTIPIGINLCKSKITPLEAAASDYAGSFEQLQQQADYFVVNVSSPNTPGLRSLQTDNQLKEILAALIGNNPNHKPILIKISPDLQWEEISGILELAMTNNLAGLSPLILLPKEMVCKLEFWNLPRSYREEAGGISGAPLKTTLHGNNSFYLGGKLKENCLLSGVGGIFTPEDAWEKITAGATLLQVYTGWDL